MKKGDLIKIKDVIEASKHWDETVSRDTLNECHRAGEIEIGKDETVSQEDFEYIKNAYGFLRRSCKKKRGYALYVPVTFAKLRFINKMLSPKERLDALEEAIEKKGVRV